ncbi:hydroxyacid-oxoacid transhydrogenase [Shumkonia mesophila]|uniref:hydroxyacid-oxoacid transhydrogenase n=1 Tax=Shumkonia mesophila TaxID=2838854 RepID=UPI002934B08D|nr:hydroxyacid-oxoacid transhydrogenase [Shumkonia mesophila]
MAVSDYFSLRAGGDAAFTFEATKETFGAGALAEIGAHARFLGMRRVALYTDPRVARLPAVEIATRSLRDKGIAVTLYDRCAVEPTGASFKAAIRFAEAGDFDGFVSVGGGSVMDTCKAANLYATHPPADFLDYVNAPIGKGRHVPGPLRPHIACPTTFGTASECTGIAIFDFEEMNAKTGIASPRLKPSMGIVDPEALATLPVPVVAANGMDVFSHAVESLTARPHTHRAAPEDPALRPLSQGANPYSDINCIEAIRLIGENLERAVANPADSEARERLMFAGMLAGIGFGTAGCAIPHGMSYAVAGLVRDYRAEGWPEDHPLVPHGFAVIVNSPSVFRHMGPACPERHLRAARALGAKTEGVNKAPGDILADKVIEMMRAIGIPNGLTGVGYTAADVPALTEKAWPQKRVIDNAPRPIARDELAAMFEGALRYW